MLITKIIGGCVVLLDKIRLMCFYLYLFKNMREAEYYK